MSVIKDVIIPDIGSDDKVDVIGVLVAVGDPIESEDSLLELESDKATMEVPAPFAGTIKEILVKLGDKVAQGDLIMKVEVNEAETAETTTAEGDDGHPLKKLTPSRRQLQASRQKKTAPVNTSAADESSDEIYASPAVRRLVRELDLNIQAIPATGRKGRVTTDDIKNYVKNGMASGGGAGLNVMAAATVDFSAFGEVAVEPLSKIKKLSGANLHRNWVTIPHVTQFDEADITDLEAFRQANKVSADGVRLTPLVFLMKAVSKVLAEMPQFNASLDASGENLVLKKYCHIGVAVDTPNGLVVPVVRDVDHKNLFALAAELHVASQKARDKKLTPKDMQGGCFSISSLGGIGGTAFTPIVNAPEVAILGVSRSRMQPVFKNGEFIPRLMLPLSLSYDHRVIDGADAARFTTRLCQILADIRSLLL